MAGAGVGKHKLLELADSFSVGRDPLATTPTRGSQPLLPRHNTRPSEPVSNATRKTRGEGLAASDDCSVINKTPWFSPLTELSNAMGGLRSERRPLLFKSFSVACGMELHSRDSHSILADLDSCSPFLAGQKNSHTSTRPGADDIRDESPLPGASRVGYERLAPEADVKMLQRSGSVGFEPSTSSNRDLSVLRLTKFQGREQTARQTKLANTMGERARGDDTSPGARAETKCEGYTDARANTLMSPDGHRSVSPSKPFSPVRRQLCRRRSYQETCGTGSAKRDAVSSEGKDPGQREASQSGSNDSSNYTADTDDISAATTPPSPKEQRMDEGSFDPYQIFEVQHLPCMILTVHVIRGRNITNGWAQDMIDTPDPYVFLRIRTAPEGRQRTRTIDNNCNPVWNEKFKFFLNLSEKNNVEISLMEANLFGLDQNMGTAYFNVDQVREFGEWQTETFNFSGTSEVEIGFHLEWDQKPTLRYSLCLSDREKDFMKKRKEKVFEGLRKFLGDLGPKTLDEVPNIAVIGSGGGFRAMVGYSGAFKALGDSGLLDCAMYACGLSGSSWYLSTLYSHPRWPDMNPGDLQDELKHNIDKSLLRLCNSVFRYMGNILAKRRHGQPISFTDFFGHMVGETLLKGRLDSKLTDQREKIRDGNVPMPLYTCVHVKKDVPERSFQEWVEFSPYEIGMPKYGTFMDSELFGSKFFMGKLVRKYDEQPLHFLQGIWGSAFCILFKRLLEDNRRLDPVEMLRQEMSKELQKEQSQSEDSDISDDNDESGPENNDDEEKEEDMENEDCDEEKKAMLFSEAGSDDSINMSSDSGDVSQDSMATGGSVTDVVFQGVDEADTRAQTGDEGSSPEVQPGDRTESPDDCQKKGVRFSEGVERMEKRKARRQEQNQGPPLLKIQKKQPEASLKRTPSVRRGKTRGYWSEILKGIFENKNFELLSTRAGRAAVIHNFMRGLSLQQTYPLSPFTPLDKRVQEGDEFDGIFDMHPTHIKHIYMVDAGLTFNSPFPLVLRPQRAIDIILSFDFSARPSDGSPPFKELLLAEKWARLNRLPFPPIDPNVVNSDDLKEMYVFRHPTDPFCPVVLHFPLVSLDFKHFTAPGVPRESKDEFSFADFSIFDDPATPYSTFNFKYSHQQFERLAKLTEFNTLNSLQGIRHVLAEAVASRRQNPRRLPFNSREIKLIRMKSVQEKRKLSKFLKKRESRSQIRSPTQSGSTPSTPFYTPTTSDPKWKKNPFVFNLPSCSSSSDSGESTENPFFRTSQEGRESCVPHHGPRKQGTTQFHSVSQNNVTSDSCTGSLDSPDDVFSASSSHKPASDSARRVPRTFPSAFRPSSEVFENDRHDSEVFESVRQDSELSSPCSQSEEFYDAPEAFTRSGVPIVDPVEAKKHYEVTQKRRQMLRRQSTITSLNSITESISLESAAPEGNTREKESCHSTVQCLVEPERISVSDLNDFEGIEEGNIVTDDSYRWEEARNATHEER